MLLHWIEVEICTAVPAKVLFLADQAVVEKKTNIYKTVVETDECV